MLLLLTLKVILLLFLHFGNQHCICCCYYDGIGVVPVDSHIDFVVCIGSGLVYTRRWMVCNFAVAVAYNY